MVILDCNAGLAMAVGTPEGEGLKAFLLEGERVIAPRLFCAELTNALQKYVRGGRLEEAEACKLGKLCFSYVDEFSDDFDMWEEVLAEAVKLKHSSYDLFYFVLTRRKAATLFTLDKKLQKLCLDNGVNCVYLDDEF